jgi:prolyl-tRNA synthetase
VQSIEVGNIFKLGTKFSEPMGLLFSDESGERKPVVMASYGIGPGRLMGTVVETSHDDRGILWPENIAPYRVHLIALDGGEQKADALYDELNEKEIEVLYDNRTDKTAGEKFADADLIGCPIRLVVSEKSIQKGGIELKRRCESSSRVLSEEEILNSVA